ncbi:ImuA family protein [Rhizobium helianthi]|uniref:ImuA family protein n=1 Tax=Rhizobium helianthi TaxID=1132695 RepID=A0ABW4M9M2_9HYPH
MAKPALAQETVFALRETIARLEGKTLPALGAAQANGTERNQRGENLIAPTGISLLDDALEGGLPRDGLTELRSLGLRHAGALSGFALAFACLYQQKDQRPLLWISDRMAAGDAGLPYPLGLKRFGLSINRLLHAAPARLEDALWLAEAALSSGIFAATLLEVRGNPANFGLTESRRLSLRAKAAARPLLILRHGGEEEASSALFRFHVEPALAAARRLPDGSMLGGSIGPSAFRLTLEKSRNPAPLSLTLEWNHHDRHFSIAEPTEQALPQQSPAHSGAPLSTAVDGSDSTPPLGAILAFERAS